MAIIDALPDFAQSPTVIGLGFMLLGALLALGVRFIAIRELNKGKTWLIGLNSNNKTGKVQRIAAGKEGHQVPNGPYVKFEGTFAYIDRIEQRPIFVYNEDTGKCIRATEGEAQEVDGYIQAAAMASDDITKWQQQGQNDWIPMAILAGVAVLVVGLIIVGVMVSKLAPA